MGDERWAMHVFEGRRILWNLVITSRFRQFVRTRRGTWFDGSSRFVVFFGRKQANKEAERISQRCASETTSIVDARARARSKAGPVQYVLTV
jgi:hypothetical protein